MAGEWYLALPAYTAAPDVGLKIMELLGSRDAELNRLRLGVGLPLRETFYRPLIERQLTVCPISPFFSMPVVQVHDLLVNAFRRSVFACYLRVHRVLAHHLKRIIELPEASDEQLEERARDLLAGARSQMDFAHIDADCARCRVRQRCRSADKLK
jgi:hypothetical protein